MHEFGLCQSVLDAVERRARGRPIGRVTVRCGVLHRVDGPSMQQAFALVAQGSVAEAAMLDVVVVPAVVTCAGCGRSTDVDDVAVSCPRCGGIDVRTTGGDELTLVSLALRSRTHDEVPAAGVPAAGVPTGGVPTGGAG
jgi:hydrogenase nickel incorporation protein HypA/HybF